MRVAVIGLGALGTRAARQLASTPDVDRVVLVDPDNERVAAVRDVLGADAVHKPWTADAPLPEEVIECESVILAGPAESQAMHAAMLLAAGRHVVTTADEPDAVRELRTLDAHARATQVTLAIGATFSPGLAGVLAKHAANWLDAVDEIHVARIGTGGPACAIQHHRSFGGRAIEWRDGEWLTLPSGSGRELCWFPDPVGSADCYRGMLPEPLLLVPSFPDVQRVTARLAGTRRDRLTARLPMMRRPHPEGSIGAIRVEVRGWSAGESRTVVLGAMDRPAVAAGAVAALTAIQAANGQLSRHGAGGLADLVEPIPFLAELARRGVKAAIFDGSDHGATPTPASEKVE